MLLFIFFIINFEMIMLLTCINALNVCVSVLLLLICFSQAFMKLYKFTNATAFIYDLNWYQMSEFHSITQQEWCFSLICHFYVCLCYIHLVRAWGLIHFCATYKYWNHSFLVLLVVHAKCLVATFQVMIFYQNKSLFVFILNLVYIFIY